MFPVVFDIRQGLFLKETKQGPALIKILNIFGVFLAKVY